MDAYVLVYQRPVDFRRPWLEFLHLAELAVRIDARETLRAIAGTVAGVRSVLGDPDGKAQQLIRDLEDRAQDPRTTPRGMVFRPHENGSDG